MRAKDVFQIWAPVGARWVDWVRPVPFIRIGDTCNAKLSSHFALPQIRYMQKAEESVAIIVDMPDSGSIKEGLALAALGFRPIPIYNGTNTQEGAMAVVDNTWIQEGLVLGASLLEKMTISYTAPPAFLLHSNRLHRYRMDVSMFDNSWDIYHQDIPSATYFLEAGIDKIIVRGDDIHQDLRRILYKFQKKGIQILFTNGYDMPKLVRIQKPSRKDQ